MEGSQNNSQILKFMRDDELSPECKNLISSLPLDKDSDGNSICNYKGCWYYFNILQAVLDVQKHFRPQETDVIVASFPKSGTTWLKALTFALVERHNYLSNPQHHPLLSENPHSLVPFLELRLYSHNKVPDLTKFSSPRLFATHMPLHTLQETLKDSPCKTVYICRNPKDTLVSSWHFRRSLLHPEVQMEAQFESFRRGTHFYGPFWDHALSYWKESLENPKHVLFMKYEALKNEPHVQIKRLAEFLDCPFTKEEEESGVVDEILDLCSLRNLSNLEVNKTGKTPSNINNNSFFRKGEVGDWKNHLSPDMAKTIDDIIQNKLQRSGLIFE